MDRGTHSSSQVAGARVEIAIFVVEEELSWFDRVTNSSDSTCKTCKHPLDVSSFLHGDDPQLVLFIDPHQEGLFCVVEDTTSLRPVAFHSSCLQVFVSTHEEEMIIHQFLSHSLIHSSKRVVLTFQIIGECFEGLFHGGLHVDSLLLGDSRRQTIAFNGATNTDTGGVNGCVFVDIANYLANIHV